MSDDTNTDETSATWDSGTGSDVVTVTAPVHTFNWALVGLIALGMWWVYNTLGSHGEDDGDWDED